MLYKFKNFTQKPLKCMLRLLKSVFNFFSVDSWLEKYFFIDKNIEVTKNRSNIPTIFFVK